ncbi:MAG: hypothetical protein K2P51_03240 [Rhabdochlamydiaceae bacterium]|nr:hypothetical protein [Rhabdochlamydiaceae bacterium]
MAAINPPTASGVIRFALDPREADAYSQTCRTHADTIQQQIDDSEEGADTQQLQIQKHTWDVLRDHTNLLSETRLSILKAAGVAFLGYQFYSSGRYKLPSGVATTLGVISVVGETAILLKISHGFLSRAHRLTTQPQEALANLQEFTEPEDDADLPTTVVRERI